MVREKLHAALVQPSQMIFAHRTRIAELAAKNRLPAMGIIRWFAEAGGLMSYGARDIDQFLRAVYYVHKILKGAKPADLPIEQPTRFEMVINLKTAKALGLTIPQSLRRRTRSAW
jgi:putative ABC transport system substrate-binding protein